MVTIERQDRIAIVRFDRGTRANPMSAALLRELTKAARSFEDDDTLAAVVLTGTAENFSMGADLKDPEREVSRSWPMSRRRLAMQAGGKMCRAWEELEPLTIAAIEGWCVGGGAAISVACDLRVSSRSATFYVPEIERGMNLSWGAVPRITHLVGPAKAKRIIILSEKIPAATAQDWGLVDQICEPLTLLAHALYLAPRMLPRPPRTMRLTQTADSVPTRAPRGAPPQRRI